MCKRLLCTVLLCNVFAVWGSTAQAQLVGLWNFDEGAGTSAIDRSGNGYHGTIVNAQYEAGGFDGSGFTMRIYKNGQEAGTLAKGGDAVYTDSTVNVAIGSQDR